MDLSKNRNVPIPGNKTNLIGIPLELIGPILGPDDAGVVGSAKLWGLTVTVPVETFETFSARLKEKRLAGTARDAVQPGRRIVTCKASRELGVALAFITPHVGSSSSRL